MPYLQSPGRSLPSSAHRFEPIRRRITHTLNFNLTLDNPAINIQKFHPARPKRRPRLTTMPFMSGWILSMLGRLHSSTNSG